MSLVNTYEHLEQILAALLQPNSDTIRQAEQALKPLLLKASVVSSLMTIIQNSPNAAVRQIAAVVLRKKIAKLWKKVKKSTQVLVKDALLARLHTEPERIVRKSLAALASTLAKSSSWPELLLFVSECARQQQSAGHRELAYMLLLHMSETVAASLSGRLGEVASLFANALNDPDRTVCAAALRACCAFIATLSVDDDALLFRDLVPQMVQVARVAAVNREDTVLSSFLDCLSELAQTPVPVINPYIVEVTQLLLDMMRAPDEALDSSIRDSAAQVVGTLAEWKPKLIGKNNLVPTIVETCISILARTDTSKPTGSLFMSQILQRLRAEEEALQKSISHPSVRNEDDDEDYEGPSLQEMAQQTLDQVALHVPQKWSLEPTLSLIARCLQDDDEATRRSGAAAMGVVAEGFQDALRERHLGQVLNLLERAAVNSDTATRECLCFAYGQLAEHCQPEIVGFAPRILPVVFEFIQDKRAAVVGTSCYVLETFCESMDAEEINAHLQLLMERLLVLLNHQLLGIREMAAAAIGAAAVAASENFLPYLDRAGDTLATMCDLTDEIAWELRGRSLETLGHIALAVGSEKFAKYRDHALHAATKNLDFDSTELAEYSYGFFANIAKVMRHEFAPLIPQLVPHLLDVISRQDGATFDYKADDDDDGTGVRMPFLDDADADAAVEAEDGLEEWVDTNDEEDDDDLQGHAIVQVRTAVMNLKKAAIVALGNAAEFTDGAIEKCLVKALETIKSTVNYFHHEIRERSAVVLQQLVHAACVAYGGDQRNECYRGQIGLAAAAAATMRKEPRAIQWLKGDPNARLANPQLQAYVDECVALLIRLLIEDTSKSVVAHACEALGDILVDVGPAILLSMAPPDPSVNNGAPRRFLESILDSILNLARGSASCQTLLNGDEDDEALRAAIPGAAQDDDDDDDHDNVLMDNVSDLCGAVARTAGGLIGLDPAVAIFQAFSKYVMPARSVLDRAMAIGCYAELCYELPPELAAARHFATLLPLFSQACADSHPNIKRNGAFGLGSLFVVAPTQASPHLNDALTTLYPLLEKADNAPEECKAAEMAAADNAVASMCRIAISNKAEAPIDQVLGVVLPRLPLLEDPGENKTVFEALLFLLNENHPALANHGDQLKRAFRGVTARSKIDDPDVASAVSRAAAQLMTSTPQYNPSLVP
mmetsp:Transcript_20737/g.26835  ORF Transcript_20737/g.26835 Transcript_20737/m.26835 type:complete len:1175 (-) Transcript_20737:204-3728(-)